MTSETESVGKAQIGHVLTIEVVEYSTLLITEQNRITEAPIECAMEIATATKSIPKFGRRWESTAPRKALAID